MTRLKHYSNNKPKINQMGMEIIMDNPPNQMTMTPSNR